MTEIVRGQIIILLDEYAHRGRALGDGDYVLPAMSFVQVMETDATEPALSPGEVYVRYECDDFWKCMTISQFDLGRRWTLTSDVWDVDTEWDTRRVINSGEKLPRVVMPG